MLGGNLGSLLYGDVAVMPESTLQFDTNDDVRLVQTIMQAIQGFSWSIVVFSLFFQCGEAGP